MTLPANYEESSYTYHDQTVAAAMVADSDAPMLFYLSNASGDTGGYYIFNAQKDTLYPYKTVSSVSKTYILLQPDGSVPLPDGFAETTLTIDDKDYTAWKAQDAQGDIYLLYARNANGEVGYYAYNPADQSLQRYAVMPARPVQPTLPPEEAAETPAPAPQQSPAPAEAGTMTVSATLFYAICGAGALLLILLIVLLVIRAAENKRRKERAAKRKAQRERARKQELDQ